ncbi:MAG: DUF3368 domain-containing protein [Halobacteriota archaeon]
MPVVDSSPLIYLGKIGKLNLLIELFGELVIPPSVYNEVVVQGEQKGFEDAKEVKKEINNFLIQMPEQKTVKDIRDRLPSGLRLGSGEMECIALCVEREKLMLSDDEDAKKFARVYGVKGKGTLYILLRSYKQGFLSKSECIESFEAIVDAGFWIDARTTSLFYRHVEKIARGL